jgi:Domain of unknown function (DUF4333)
MDIESPSPRVIPIPTVARVVGARRATIAAVAALACAVLMSACGSSASKTNLDTARVAASIEQSILNQRHIHAKVSCPAVEPQQQGKTFECTATIRSTKRPFAVSTTPFVVTVQNSKGDVTYVGK